MTGLLTGTVTRPDPSVLRAAVPALTVQCAPGGPTTDTKPAKPATETRTPEQTERLVADILAVIEQMEVGKGGAVTESTYRTSSGVRASYASRMQATIPWTIDLLKRHAELRTRFDVTLDELRAAEKTIAAVSALWRAVLALPAGTTLEQAKADPKVAAALPDSGLDDGDLGRMLAFGQWRNEVITTLPSRAERIKELQELSPEELAAQATAAELATALKPANQRALAQWRKAKQKGKPPPATVADLTDKERRQLAVVIGTRQVVDPLRQAGVDAGVGLDAGSARRYVIQEMRHQDNPRTSAHWGEDLAAWRRYAVEKSLPEIGEKIRQAATDDEGMTLGRVSIGDAVAALARKHPTWDDDQVAWQAFKQHNGSAGYADEALTIFKRTHRTTPAEPSTP